MKNLPYSHVFRGKRYRITMATKRALKGHYGDCDSPTEHEKVIRINKGLMKPGEDQQLMETLIHEGMHACTWDAAEEMVHGTAESLAKLLWRCGYRRIMEI